MLPEKKSFSQQAAEFSVVAPFVVFVIGMVTKGLNSRSSAILLASIQGLMLIAGIALGIVALLGIKKHGKEGIIGKAISGIVLNLAVISLIVAGILKARERAHLRKEKAKADLEEQGRQSYFQFKSWSGYYVSDSVKYAFNTLPDNSPVSKTFNDNFKNKVSFSQLVIVNESQEELIIDTSKFKIKLLDGNFESFIPAEKILNSAIEDRDKLKSYFLGPHRIKPLSKYMNVMLFTPMGYNWENVASITIDVNGKEFEIEGRIFTEDEKKQLQKMGQQ